MEVVWSNWVIVFSEGGLVFCQWCLVCLEMVCHCKKFSLPCFDRPFSDKTYNNLYSLWNRGVSGLFFSTCLTESILMAYALYVERSALQHSFHHHREFFTQQSFPILFFWCKYALVWPLAKQQEEELHIVLESCFSAWEVYTIYLFITLPVLCDSAVVY